MSNDTLRTRMRAHRRLRGWSQARLASHSGASRVTVARFETGAGRDVRLETLERVCVALDLELLALPRGENAAHEVRSARQQEQLRRLDRRRRHAQLAVRLLTESPAVAERHVQRARRRVDRWEREGLCSAHYITRWRTKLSGPLRRVARALVTNDDWTDALLQSSPWTFALEKSAP